MVSFLGPRQEEEKKIKEKYGRGYFGAKGAFRSNQKKHTMEGVATDPRSERMNKMVAAFDKAMTKTLNGCTQKLFLESYPAQLTAEHKDIFIAAHERFLPVLHTNIKVRLRQALLNSHL